ncbi:MAG: hypothetical protein ABGX16_20835 [Pirellulales bacterium]
MNTNNQNHHHFQLTPRASRLVPRRGILLLIVLSMLVLFLMLGTAFVITAKQSSQAARSLSRAYEAAASPMRQDDLLNEVFGQLLRDTNNQNSALRYHSLLRDLYGNDGFTVRIDPTLVLWPGTGDYKGATGGQILQLGVVLDSERWSDGTPTAAPPLGRRLSTTEGQYNGLVLTVLEGKARGASARIIRHHVDFTTGLPQFLVMAFKQADGSPLPEIATDLQKTFTKNTSTNTGILVAINGRPFNGTGVGYDLKPAAPVAPAVTSALLTSAEQVAGILRPLALMPNPVFVNSDNILDNDYLTQQELSAPGITPQIISARKAALGLAGPGGSDESYEAVDYQNIFLGLMPANPIESTAFGSGSLQGTSAGTGPKPMVPIPSFHRPALLNFWNSQLGSLATDPSMLRKVLLRPSWFDHPNFTGSNPNLAGYVFAFNAALASGNSTNLQTNANALLDQMIYGPWDVDNDNDGVRDSIWVDFGAPVIQRPDGTMVKPLAAILCIDMDGRLNLNAHGSRQLAGMEGLPQPPLSSTFNDLAVQTGGTAPQFNSLPRGQGYGPAEISLLSLLPQKTFQQLLEGFANTAGRFGKRKFPGRQAIDPRTWLKLRSLPQWFSNTTMTEFSTPPDLIGRYAQGLNNFGQPLYEASSDNVRPMNENLPYAIDLLSPSNVSDDMPFTLGELERLLRAFDFDSGSLPSRLWEFAKAFNPLKRTEATPVDRNRNAAVARRIATTDSWDLPVPNFEAPSWVLNGPDNKAATMADNFEFLMGRPPVNITLKDILDYRIRLAENWTSSTVQPIQVNQRIAQLLSIDHRNGLRMDINRPLGNGRDDQENSAVGTLGKGVVDEPLEVGEINNSTWRTGAVAVQPGDPIEKFQQANFNYPYDEVDDGSGNGTTTLVPTDPRHLMARYLYVLAMTLVDPFDPSTTEGKAKVRQLAQWAINVVDFRDPDSIMSAFEYDINPFDGWDVDGNANHTLGPNNTNDGGTGDDDKAVDRDVVWGCERPELLITETIAWHDLRTEDLANEDPAIDPDTDELQDAAGSSDPLNEPNGEFDQLRQPRGAFFLELYNPWPTNPAANADIHDKSTMPGVDLGVNLAAVDAFTKQSPVWRLVVYKDGGLDRDPDDPDPNFQPTAIDRSVYFTDFDPQDINPQWGDDGVAFYKDPEHNFNIQSVRPGRYMVIGSGDETSSGKFTSPLGDLDPTENGTILRRVELEPSNSSTPLRYVEPLASLPDLIPPADPDPLDARRTSMCDVAVIDMTSSSQRRLTLSEPAKGYPLRVGNVEWAQPQPNQEGLYYLGGDTNKPKPVDIPLDLDRTDGETRLVEPGTVENFSWIYLQRLANPLLPWNPEAGKPGHDPNKMFNPYRTVDATSANVTVFNGREFTAAPNAPAGPEFASLERGSMNSMKNPGTDTSNEGNLWSMENPGLRQKKKQQTDKTHIFKEIPEMTLGFLNKSFEEPTNLDQMTPKMPFPWLTWNNRPFVSQMELLQVPAVRSSQLLKAFSMKSAGAVDEKYSGSTTKYPNLPNLETDGLFGHLQNFFRDKSTGNQGIAGLYRMLEYLHVPSRYAGTETWLNPSTFGSGGSLLTDPNDPRAMLQPPFNHISNYRDPGRINLNTIHASQVLDGLFHRDLGGTLVKHPGPDWAELVNSRRGYMGTGMLKLDALSPTFFANPFRSPDASNLVPIDSMLRTGLDCTLLRTIDGTSGNTATSKGQPLFAADTFGSGNEYRDSDRNSYYRYQPLTRLANLTTSRSNVFAVWVTVGFFEVEDVPNWNSLSDPEKGRYDGNPSLYNRVYPNGYTFGREAGSETGDTRRLRGFSIIDRTIPVAFEPGQEHNSRKAVRLRRRIE